MNEWGGSNLFHSCWIKLGTSTPPRPKHEKKPDQNSCSLSRKENIERLLQNKINFWHCLEENFSLVTCFFCFFLTGEWHVWRFLGETGIIACLNEARSCTQLVCSGVCNNTDIIFFILRFSDDIEHFLFCVWFFHTLLRIMRTTKRSAQWVSSSPDIMQTAVQICNKFPERETSGRYFFVFLERSAYSFGVKSPLVYNTYGAIKLQIFPFLILVSQVRFGLEM